MKNHGRNILLLMAVALSSVTSCVNDNLSDNLGNTTKEVPALAEQAAAVETSVGDVEALQTALEPLEVTLDGAVEALDAHIAFLRGGVSLEEGALATLELQKHLAGIIGAAEAELLSSGSYDRNLKRRFSILEAGVTAWLGKSFGCWYPVAVAEAKVNETIAAFDLMIRKQQLYVDALASDVEAGFRKDENPEELTALAASVQTNAKEASALSKEIAAMAEGLEAGYIKAITTAVSDPENFDASALRQLNASIVLTSVDNSLEGLISRVEACETQLADIMARLGVLEETVGSLQDLLGQMQSVTFMSEFSNDNAVAYYDLATTKNSEGLSERVAASTVTLNYVVRPASTATALTDQSLWNEGLKVIGYYAGRIEQSAVNLETFEITDVAADATSGVVTVTVKNTLTEDFYFKRTGAKIALSVATGKTDLTTSFVEIVPKDASNTVYIESLSLSADYIEVDSELTAQLKAVISPDNVTNPTLIWTSSNHDIAVVSGEGLVTAGAVGEATITVTTQGTDEWGQNLSKTCRVKVMPNIKLEAAKYVEEGGSTTINIKSPNYIDKQYVKWSSSDTNYATVDEDGVVTGVASTYDSNEHYYKTITITCTIGDYMPTVLTHEMPVVVPQPKGVKISSLADGVEQKTIKIGEAFSLAGSITPETASDYFRLMYLAAGGGNASVASINYETGAVTATSPGSVTFIARVLDKLDTKYYYPVGTEVWRFVTVNVEPYYVESVSFANNYYELPPGGTLKITPEIKSDVDGKSPSYSALKWTSSDTSVATVDENTGNITAIKDGTCRITATTSHEYAVPSGESPISASFSLGVVTPTKEVKPGDFFYSDGDWSSEYDGRTVVGIVIASANVSGADGKLRDAGYDKCSHGIVLGLKEYTEKQFGLITVYDASHGDNVLWHYLDGKGIEATNNTDVTNGYALTQAYAEYCTEYNITGSMFDATNGVAALANGGQEVTPPADASPWYVPSYYEMYLIYSNLGAINESLTTVSGTQINNELYWSSSCRRDAPSSSYHDMVANPFSISSGTWYTTDSNRESKYPVRVVLAF